MKHLEAGAYGLLAFLAGIALVGATGVRATTDVDGLPYAPSFNNCQFHGRTAYIDTQPYVSATTDKLYNDACNQKQLYVSMNFVGSDYNWHYYPEGPSWGTSLNVYEYYWTNRTKGAHQLYEPVPCACNSMNYFTDTDNP